MKGCDNHLIMQEIGKFDVKINVIPNGLENKRLLQSLKNFVFIVSIHLLLADVFEKFIEMYLEYYGLDPCHYFKSPGLSCDAMLKMTKIELELNLDIDMYLLLQKE